MTTDRVGALEALLVEAQAAHSVFEASELNGVYDQDWPRWYAQYAVEHGIGDLLGRAVTVDELTLLLETSWDELQEKDSRPAEPWAAYTARLIASRLQS
jgi:hypothetical protein